MKKNRRILGRNLAKELDETDLCQVRAGAEAGAGTGSVLVHCTHSFPYSHDDCHIDAVDRDEVLAESGEV